MQLALNPPNPLAARESLFTDHGLALTSSTAVAARFGKSHDKVVRDIEQLLADLTVVSYARPSFQLGDAPKSGDISGLKFEETTYLDSRKREQKMYRLTFADFSLVTMGFTGIKALRWKVDYITAFNQMEARLRSPVKREANAFRIVRPTASLAAEGLAQGLSRKATAALAGRSESAITRARATARRLGLLPLTH